MGDDGESFAATSTAIAEGGGAVREGNRFMGVAQAAGSLLASEVTPRAAGKLGDAERAAIFAPMPSPLHYVQSGFMTAAADEALAGAAVTLLSDEDYESLALGLLDGELEFAVDAL